MIEKVKCLKCGYKWILNRRSYYMTTAYCVECKKDTKVKHLGWVD